MGLKKFVEKLVTPSNSYKPGQGAGNIFLKPSEAAKQSGGYVSTTNPNIPATYGAGSTSDIVTSNSQLVPSGSVENLIRGGSGRGGSGGGGSGGGGNVVNTIEQQKQIQEKQAQLQQQKILSVKELAAQQAYQNIKNRFSGTGKGLTRQEYNREFSRLSGMSAGEATRALRTGSSKITQIKKLNKELSYDEIKSQLGIETYKQPSIMVEQLEPKIVTESNLTQSATKIESNKRLNEIINNLKNKLSLTLGPDMQKIYMKWYKNVELDKAEYSKLLDKSVELEKYLSDENVKIDNLKNSNVDISGNWVGSENKLNEYNSMINEYNSKLVEYDKINNQLNDKKFTRTFGFYNYKKVVPVTQIKNIFSPVVIETNVISEATGVGAGKIYEFGVKATHGAPALQATKQLIKGEITAKEYLSGFKKKKGEIINIDLDKDIASLEDYSKLIYSTQQQELLPYQEKRKEQIQKLATTGVKTGAYFIPYVGTTIFGAETGELALDAFKTKKTTGSFTPEQISQMVINGGIILTAGAIKFAKGQGIIAKGISKLEQAEYKLGIEGGLGQRYWKWVNKRNINLNYIFSRPKDLHVDIKVEYGKKLGVKTYPKDIEYKLGETSEVRTTKQGYTTIQEEFPIGYKTELTGNNYKEIQHQDVFGNVDGQIIKSNYKIKYNYDRFKNEIFYKILDDKNVLILEGNLPISNSFLFGLGEKSVSTIGVKKTEILDKQKVYLDKTLLKINEKFDKYLLEKNIQPSLFEQNIIPLTPEYQFEKVSPFKTKIISTEELVVTPAKRSKIAISKGENLPEVIVTKEVERTAPIISKEKGKGDLFNIHDIQLEQEFETLGGEVYESPQFVQKVRVKKESIGSFDISQKTSFDNFMKKILSEKKPIVKIEKIETQPISDSMKELSINIDKTLSELKLNKLKITPEQQIEKDLWKVPVISPEQQILEEVSKVKIPKIQITETLPKAQLGLDISKVKIPEIKKITPLIKIEKLVPKKIVTQQSNVKITPFDIINQESKVMSTNLMGQSQLKEQGKVSTQKSRELQKELQSQAQSQLQRQLQKQKTQSKQASKQIAKQETIFDKLKDEMSFKNVMFKTRFKEFKPFVSLSLQKKKIEEPKKEIIKSLGPGYHVLIKPTLSDTFKVLNRTPVTQNRVKDIGAYYTLTELSRTFKIVKTNQPAQYDYEFQYIPSGYYEQNKKKFRNYKIKEGVAYDIEKQFIQKSKYILSTPEEKAKIQQFRKEQENFSKNVFKI